MGKATPESCGDTGRGEQESGGASIAGLLVTALSSQPGLLLFCVTGVIKADVCIAAGPGAASLPHLPTESYGQPRRAAAPAWTRGC